MTSSGESATIPVTSDSSIGGGDEAVAPPSLPTEEGLGEDGDIDLKKVYNLESYGKIDSETKMFCNIKDSFDSFDKMALKMNVIFPIHR